MREFLNEKIYREGEKVHGRFHGVYYTGFVESSRPNTMNHLEYMMFVKFDKPIDCGSRFGTRESGLISAWHDQGFDHVIRGIDEEIDV